MIQFKKSLIEISCLTLLITNIGPANAAGGRQIIDGKIASIDVGPHNKDGFSINFDSGTGKCQSSVSFVEPNVTAERWKAALTVATTAMVAQKKVEIHSHTDVLNCKAATWIRVIK